MTNYWISEVRYNAVRTRIAAVLIHPDQDGCPGSGMVVYRDWLLQQARNGAHFTTVRRKHGELVEGDEVKFVNDFLRTEGQKEEDDLGLLPEF